MRAINIILEWKPIQNTFSWIIHLQGLQSIVFSQKLMQVVLYNAERNFPLIIFAGIRRSDVKVTGKMMIRNINTNWCYKCENKLKFSKGNWTRFCILKFIRDYFQFHISMLCQLNYKSNFLDRSLSRKWLVFVNFINFYFL